MPGAALKQEDDTSFILQEDGSSLILLEVQTPTLPPTPRNRRADMKHLLTR